VIALTANAMASDVERGIEAGFFRYLTKPIDIDRFNEAIDGTLAYLRSGRRAAGAGAGTGGAAP
jgi:CheY-like chemotaxis protein